VGYWSELLIVVLPNPRKAAVKVGEEHCFDGGKVWLTSHFEEATGVLSSNDAYGLSHSHPKWWPNSAWSGREIHIETFGIQSGNLFIC